MGGPMGHGREESGISRRTMVVATLATATVAAASHLTQPAHAQAPDPIQDMMAFVLLSEALTGVDKHILAPEFSGSDTGTDPINIKNDYFKWISAKDKTSSFVKLLGFAKVNSTSHAILVSVRKGDENVQFLARSIVLLWYLGTWYDPGALKDQAHSTTPAPLPPEASEVVSPKAYTQGLVWRIAGAHPMGYSNMQFGYWSHNPSDPNDLRPLLAPPESP